MKVLKSGWPKKKKCTADAHGNNGCGAILLVEKDDLFLAPADGRNNPDGQYPTFECPECTRWTSLYWKDVPDMQALLAVYSQSKAGKKTIQNALDNLPDI